MHSELLNLPLLIKGKTGEGLSEEDMYKHVSTLLQYVILDNDPAESWNLRKRARDGVKKLKAATEQRVRQTSRSGGLLGSYFGIAAAPAGSLSEIGQKLTKNLLDSGYSVEDTATTLFTSAAGGVPNLPNSVSFPYLITSRRPDADTAIVHSDSRLVPDPGEFKALGGSKEACCRRQSHCTQDAQSLCIRSSASIFRSRYH